MNQIELILDVLGTPSDDELRGSPKAKRYVQSLPLKLKQKWSDIFPHASELALDLLDKMLKFDPLARITADEALAHPYLEDLYDPKEVPKCEKKFDFNVELQTKEMSEQKDFLKSII